MSAKPFVDGGEAQIGDVVESTEPFEDSHPDLLTGHLGPFAPQRLFDLLGQFLELLLGDGPVLGGGPHPGDDLGPVERLPLTGPLGHPQRSFFEALIGREPPPARQALATPADDAAFLSQTRVDDLVVETLTPRTPHTANLVPPRPGSGKKEPLPRSHRFPSDLGGQGGHGRPPIGPGNEPLGDRLQGVTPLDDVNGVRRQGVGHRDRAGGEVALAPPPTQGAGQDQEQGDGHHGQKDVAAAQRRRPGHHPGVVAPGVVRPGPVGP